MRVTVARGDALNFERYLPDNAPIASIVSGLPLLNFPYPVRHALIKTRPRPPRAARTLYPIVLWLAASGGALRLMGGGKEFGVAQSAAGAYLDLSPLRKLRQRPIMRTLCADSTYR